MIACELTVTSTVYSGSVACMADLMVLVGADCWVDFRCFYEQGDPEVVKQCQGGLSVGATGQDYGDVVFTQAYRGWDSDGLGAVLSHGLNLDPLAGFMLALDLQSDVQSYLAQVHRTVLEAVEGGLTPTEFEDFKAGLLNDTAQLETKLNRVAGAGGARRG